MRSEVRPSAYARLPSRLESEEADVAPEPAQPSDFNKRRRGTEWPLLVHSRQETNVREGSKWDVQRMFATVESRRWGYDLYATLAEALS